MSNKEIAIKYANDLLTDTIPSCLFMKQASQRFLDDLENPLYFYDEERVREFVEFANGFYLTEQKKPKHFILEPWQTFIVANIYGLIGKEDNFRKYKYAYIELARKQGKSELVIIMALYDLLYGVDSQVIVSANSWGQIKKTDYKKVKQFLSQFDPKGKFAKQRFNYVEYKGNELFATATNPGNLDGLNISFCLIDELHEAKNGDMYNVFKSGMGRDESLMVIITTAGFDTDSFCHQLRDYYIEILAGKKIKEDRFCVIYTIDEDDDIANEKNWYKANPNLGISYPYKSLKENVETALENELEKPGILVKHFNVWLKNNTMDIWINDDIISKASTKISLDDERFKGRECFVGVDLSTVSDISAVDYLIELDGKLYFFNDYYICADSLNTNINRQLFKEKASMGYINITPGNVIDYDYILNDILRRRERNPIRQINYDDHNATQFAINATNAGLWMKPFSQLAGNINAPMKEFERLIKSGKSELQYNPITIWMFSNVKLLISKYGNISMNKESRSKKIDGVAAIIDATGGWMEANKGGFRVY